MQRFFYSGKINGPLLSIDDKEVINQINKVLRLKVRDKITFFDNSGSDYICEITHLEKNDLECAVLKKTQGQTFDKNITLYQALIKKDKLEWVVQKATELGVSRIVLINCDNCVKNEVSEAGLERLRQISREATEQSEGSILCSIESPTTFDLAITSLAKNSTGLIALSRNGTKNISAINLENEVTLFIGPEGGFSPREEKVALDCGLIPLSLGPRILRSETAAVAALGRIIIT